MRAKVDETAFLPPGPLGGIVWSRRLDGRATLVGSRPEGLHEEDLHHRVCICAGSNRQEIDRADVTAGSNGGTDRENRAARNFPTSLGDEDARVGKVDQLTEHVRSVQGSSRPTIADLIAAERDKSVDIGDSSCSDRVIHAVAGTSIGWRPSMQTTPTGVDRGRQVPQIPGGANVVRSRNHLDCANRCCNRCAEPYHTTSLRRQPARRPNWSRSQPPRT